MGQSSHVNISNTVHTYLDRYMFTVLQSDPHSPLFSTLSLLPKDQTLKRATKHPRSRLVLPNTSHSDKRLNTKSIRLSIIPRIAQAPPDSCRTRRPCSVVTWMASARFLVIVCTLDSTK